MPEVGEYYAYNAQGYALKTQDAKYGTNGRTYHQVLATNARGQVTSEDRGVAVLTTLRAYQPATGWVTSIQTDIDRIQDLQYTYDILGNTASRSDQTGTRNLREEFAYDYQQRLTSATLYSNAALVGSTSYAYDNGVAGPGNLTAKTAVGFGSSQSYAYSQKPAYCNGASEVDPGPHAAHSVGGTSYCFDAVGNQTRSSDGRTIRYTAFDLPDRITHTATSKATEFDYGTARERIRRKDIPSTSVGVSPNLVTHFVGNAEILRYATGKVEVRRYVAGMIRVQTLESGNVSTREDYLLTDAQGSTYAVVRDTGLVQGTMSFDAWGQRRGVTNWTPLASPLAFDASGVTRHGYTGHEQVDEMGLIHMNGRIYDPKLMRFVQADPIIQSPFDSQSYNRYSYVFNNPLAHTDPSGYWGRKEQGYLRAAVAIVITIYTGGTAAGASWGVFGGASLTTGQAFAVTVIGGAAAGAVQTGTLKGAATGAASAAMFFGIGQYFDSAQWAHIGKDLNASLSGAGHAVKTLAHGAAGGITAELGGGNFGNGFISAGVTQAFAPGIDHVDTGNAGFSAARTIAAAAVGGTASALSGGKFANGAVTAAFARAFNDEANSHRVSVDRGLDPNGFDSPDDATLAAFVRDEERYFELPKDRELLGAVVEITIGGASRYFPTTSIEVPANFRVSLSISGGGDTVALFHTHPATPGQEFFSPSDGSQARMNPFYVRTPSGDARVLTGAMVNRELAGVRSAAARAAASYRGRSICAGGSGCLAPHPGEQ